MLQKVELALSCVHKNTLLVLMQIYDSYHMLLLSYQEDWSGVLALNGELTSTN